MTGCWIINMILLAVDKRRSVSAGHCNSMSVAGVRGAGARAAGARVAGARVVGAKAAGARAACASGAGVRVACASGAGMRTAGVSGAGVSTPGGLLPPTDSCDETAMSSPGVTGVILPKDALAEPVTGGELCHTVRYKTRSEV